LLAAARLAALKFSGFGFHLTLPCCTLLCPMLRVRMSRNGCERKRKLFDKPPTLLPCQLFLSLSANPCSRERGASCPHLPPTRRLKLSSKVTTYTYLAPFQGRVRARRGNDVRAERCPRVRRDQTALWSVLGLHIANFPMFSPIRETTHPPKNTVFALARPRDVLVQSSATRDLAHGPCAPPPTSRRAPRCAVHGWANTKGSSVGPSRLPHHLWR
jgi:hypothetical protein